MFKTVKIRFYSLHDRKDKYLYKINNKNTIQMSHVLGCSTVLNWILSSSTWSTPIHTSYVLQRQAQRRKIIVYWQDNEQSLLEMQISRYGGLVCKPQNRIYGFNMHKISIRMLYCCLSPFSSFPQSLLYFGGMVREVQVVI